MSQRLFVATATATGAADAPDECVCALFFFYLFHSLSLFTNKSISKCNYGRQQMIQIRCTSFRDSLNETCNFVKLRLVCVYVCIWCVVEAKTKPLIAVYWWATHNNGT